jgi:hypothetical protein
MMTKQLYFVEEQISALIKKLHVRNQTFGCATCIYVRDMIFCLDDTPIY